MDKRRCTSCGKQFAFDRKHRLVSCPRCSAVQVTSDEALPETGQPFGSPARPARPAAAQSAKPIMSATMLWSMIASVLLVLILVSVIVAVSISVSARNRVAAAGDSADKSSPSDTEAAVALRSPQAAPNIKQDSSKTEASPRVAQIPPATVSPVEPDPGPSMSEPPRPNVKDSAAPEKVVPQTPAPQPPAPKPPAPAANAELESLKKMIESGQISSSAMLGLASTPVDMQYRDQIAGALHAYVGSRRTMDDPTTLAMIRWANLDTPRVLRGKLESGKGIDVAFFYALVCVGSDSTLKDLASLDMVAEADYPLLQMGQPEWILRMDQYNSQEECLQLEKFFTDYLLESRHYPVRKMGLYGCLLCGRGYCLNRVADMTESDPAPDVKDMARKVWEEISYR